MALELLIKPNESVKVGGSLEFGFNSETALLGSAREVEFWAKGAPDLPDTFILAVGNEMRLLPNAVMQVERRIGDGVLVSISAPRSVRIVRSDAKQQD